MGPSLPSVLDPPPDPSRPPDSPEPLALPALHLDLAPPGHLGSAPPGSLGPDLPGSLEPLAVQALALETLGLRCQASPPPWSPSCSLSLGSANRTPETPEYENGPAEYNFEYKVADDEQQNYIARQESRDGDTVTGSYNYVNPAGTLVTVNYEAGPDGFKQETSEQKGAVQMRNVPVGWDGPL